MKKIIILLLLFPVLVLAQNYELGKVTLAELNQKQNPTDTSAVATILFSKGKTHFDYVENSHFELVTEIEVKIKIHKKEGLHWANKEVNYYVGGEDDELVIINKATTYNLVNGKIEKTKLNVDGEFQVNVNKFWASKKITLPNVKVGSVIEYKYTIKSPYFSNLQDWKFQETIPVNYSEYVTVIPEYFSYNFYGRGSVKISTKSDVKYRNIEILDEDLAKKGRNITSQNNSSRIALNENVTTLYALNIPALIKENYTNNVENYLSSIQYQLASIQYPNQKIKIFSETWEDVAKNINENNDFGKELKKDSHFENDYVNLVSGKDLTSNAKIDVIYDYVKNYYTWNETSGIYTDVGVSKAYIDRTGNVAEINFTLISMLRKAGLNANPILLATRSRAVSLFPSTTAFNYIICGVEIGDKIIFLDATDKLLKPDVLPTRALNYVGRLVRENGTSLEIDLSPKVHSKKTVMIFATIENQALKGNIKNTLTENKAYSFRSKNSSISEDSYLENIEKNRNGFEISDYKIENKTKANESLKEDYQFALTNEVEVINDKLFFKPLLFFALDENPFKSEEREHPIDFLYPFHDNYTINYIIPEGYVVESMPEKGSFAMSENIGIFNFIIANINNKIQIACNFQMNTSILSSKYYSELKEFYNQVYLKMNEKIVLKKK